MSMRRRPRSGRLPFLVFRFSDREQVVVASGWGKVGNLFLVFHFPLVAKPGRWECGNLAPLARFPRDGGKSGKAVFAFPLFPRARHFHGPVCSTGFSSSDAM